MKSEKRPGKGKNCYAKFMDGDCFGIYAEAMENDYWYAFRQNLIRLRDKNGLSQEQLAEMLGVSRTAVAKWEAGHGMPKLKNIVILAKLFEISLDELLLEEMD